MKRWFGLILILLVGLSLAQDESGFVQEDAHEHGAALLNVVLDGEALSMEFISPAVNLVGFEYEPSTEEEMQAVSDVLTALESGPALFTPADNAGCTLASAETEHVMNDEEGHEHGEDHSDERHGDEDHAEGDHGEDEEHSEDKEHDEEQGDAEHSEEHGDEEHGEDHAEEGAQHSEFHATYSFTCSSPDNLSSVDLSELFTLYPGIEDLDVQYVLPGGQGAAELGADNSSLTF